MEPPVGTSCPGKRSSFVEHLNSGQPLPSDTASRQAHTDVITKEPEKNSLMGIAANVMSSAEPHSPLYTTGILSDDSSGCHGAMVHGVGALLGAFGSIPCIPIPSPYGVVKQGYVGLVTKFGKLRRVVPPGLVCVNLLTEKLFEIDVKPQTLEIPKLTCLTKDNVTVSLVSAIYYLIVAPEKSVFGVGNVKTSLVQRVQNIIHLVVSATLFSDLVASRASVMAHVQSNINSATQAWGVQVVDVLIDSMTFSPEVQDALSMAAQGQLASQSKIANAEMEIQSAELMSKAADIISSPPAMQLRYLETMQSMAKTANSKVIFLPPACQSANPSGHCVW